jgi:TolA-binding protein
MGCSTVPEAGFQWALGAISFIGLAGVVLTFYIQLKKIKKDTENTVADRESKIKSEAESEMSRMATSLRREIETETALRDMKSSIDRLNESFQALGRGIEQRVERLEKGLQTICTEHATVTQATKSAHRRIDEHRKLEHNLTSKMYKEIDEITNGNEKEGWLG